MYFFLHTVHTTSFLISISSSVYSSEAKYFLLRVTCEEEKLEIIETWSCQKLMYESVYNVIWDSVVGIV